jgi:hypothetical protein
MKIRNFIHAAAAVALTAFVSCTPDGGSIYYILENEQKQPPSSLGSTISVFDVARLDDSYFTAAYTIFEGEIGTGGDVTWVSGGESNPLTTLPASNARCTALTAYDGDLWGGFRTDSTNLGLYRANETDFRLSNGGTKIIDAGLDGQQVVRLIVSNNVLLIISAASTGESDTPFYYCLTAYDGAVFTQLVTAADEVGAKIRDAVYHIGTATYFAVSGNKLLSGGAHPLDSTNELDSYTIGSSNTLQGIHSNGTYIVISSKTGGIYVSDDDGTTYEKIDADTQMGTAVSYLGISGPLTGSNNLIIGSEGYGYYYMAPPYASLKRTEDTTMKTLKLYGAVIMQLFVDALEDNVFACTAGYGLWKGKVDADSTSGIDTHTWTIQ